MKLTYVQTLNLAIAVKEDSNQTAQIAGMIAIADYGDKQAILDGKLQGWVDYIKELRTKEKNNKKED